MFFGHNCMHVKHLEVQDQKNQIKRLCNFAGKCISLKKCSYEYNCKNYDNNSGQLRMDQSPSFQPNKFELKFNLVTKK
ncbi:hypothetical protein BpHYR1_045279 [Brachionus plicatilis]|uniref:Uncharacterized protein n=1 Tax=Brachionus plicatilis TaxID=10195 RepID=A0A3M7PVH4_BRAPC|nr:hypothetical protein BpHYR1_045279 [Brachionus plicatilis]